jgi:dienelactone hydrolase
MVAATAAWALIAVGCGGSGGSHAMADPVAAAGTPPAATAPGHKPSTPPFAVGERVLTFVDTSRTIRLPGGRREPRTLQTIIRYPARGPVSGVDVLGAPIAPGRFPLVVFGHGFAVTPYPYRKLLRAWARAGYIVAAPVFPLENANAPGGPNESDLINQPRDMRFVITRMLQAYASSVAAGQIAVSGQSDGGETALAVAYDRRFIDRRVRAAIILSGAEIPGVGGLHFAAPSPPLLATQGTADTINLPFFTYQFFDIAPRPKYLLQLLGAHHLPPYTYEQPQLGIVERVTVAFLDRYLKGERGAQRRMRRAGNVDGTAALQADP